MADPRGKVAVVTGASRGVGKGTDLGLGEAGATVCVTRRTEHGGPAQGDLPGTIHETAEAVSALGGRRIAVRCDHRDDDQVAAVFDRVATDRMVADMAHELRDHHVAALALYPELVRTEAVLRAGEYFDPSNSESSQFLGRVVAALAAEAAILERSGQVLVAAAVAQGCGVADVDGRHPRRSRLTRCDTTALLALQGLHGIDARKGRGIAGGAIAGFRVQAGDRQGLAADRGDQLGRRLHQRIGPERQ